MKADFSRDTHNPGQNYKRVLMQQGRVLLDSDWNEQSALFFEYLQTLAADLIGPHAGPAAALGFDITPVVGAAAKLEDLHVGDGRYYVDGLLCKIGGGFDYSNQAGRDKKDFDNLDAQLPLIVYIDAWERVVTSIEDPRIHEVALGDADICVRAQVVFQISWTQFDVNAAELNCLRFEGSQGWQQFLLACQPPNRGRLAARAFVPDTSDTDVCIVSPEARYRGAENQLYRVEIHHGGPAGQATFKWSRENGSVLFQIDSGGGNTYTVKNLGRDARQALEIDDWVEVSDDDSQIRGRTKTSNPAPLLQVTDIQEADLAVTLSAAPPTAGPNQGQHPSIRRWDHQETDPPSLKDGALPVVESTTADEHWIELEDGVQVRFEAGGDYRSGDYWLIPARTATGDVEWPQSGGAPALRPPRGVEHHFAPLAAITRNGAAGQLATIDLRHVISPLGACCPTVKVAGPVGVVDGGSITFTAVVGPHPATADLKYRWEVQGGTIQGPIDADSVKVNVNGAPRTFVAATVIVHGLHGQCTASARGVAVVVEKNHPVGPDGTVSNL